MRKIIPLVALCLVSCSKNNETPFKDSLMDIITFDDTPKCDDKEVLETLKDATRLEYPFGWNRTTDGDIIYVSSMIYYEYYNSAPNPDPKIINLDEDKMNYLRDRDNQKTDEKLKPIIDKYTTAHQIHNIRQISKNKENKSCECKAYVEFYNGYDSFNGNQIKFKTIDVYYTAQKNTAGEIYLEASQE